MTESAKLAIVWMVAVCLSVSAVSFALHNSNQQFRDRVTGVEDIFVGSSLMGYAIPNVPRPQQSGSGMISPSYIRLAIPGVRELELLQLAESIAQSGAKRIIIEINPIVSRFANRPKGCWRTIRLSYLKRRFKDRLHNRHFEFLTENIDLAEGPPESIRINRNLFPLRFDGPCFPDRWKMLSHSTSELLLVLMPRGPESKKLIGTGAEKELVARSEAFARQIGATLMIVDQDGSWGQRYFKDTAHVTRAGAERFQTEFSLWLESRQ